MDLSHGFIDRVWRYLVLIDLFICNVEFNLFIINFLSLGRFLF